eukprot:11626540-Prorocentrum_lima.AAC.1
MGGIQVEDISNYNRWYECLHMFQPKGKRLNDAIEGFSVGENTVTTTIVVPQNQEFTIADDIT